MVARRLGWTLIACLPLLAAAPPAAHAVIERSGTFTATAFCDAYQRPSEDSNPDLATVIPSRRYEVVGTEGASNQWIQIRVPGESPELRFVESVCGRAELNELPAAAGAAASAGFAPFFDQVDQGDGDPAPPPMPQGSLDEAVLRTCGPFGSFPRRSAFRAMLDAPEIEEDVAEIYEALGNRVVGGPTSLPAFKDELARVWFGLDGFTAVFCGLVDEGRLQGPFYAPRLLQLQERHIAGRLPPEACPGRVAAPVREVGMRYLAPESGALLNVCPASYAYGAGAKDLLISGTRALQALAPLRRQKMCIQRVDIGSQAFNAELQIDGTDILNFMPTAAPACPDNQPLRRCLCGVPR